MKKLRIMTQAGCIAALLGVAWVPANATEPCGDFGECKVLIEINSTDGDVGFHFLGDGDEVVKMELTGPDGEKVFEDKAKGPLREQTMTETFLESAEPLCWPDPEALAEDPDEDVVSLEEFLETWPAGFYQFYGQGAEGEMSFGETELTLALPAAPFEVEFELEEEEPGEYEGDISWEPGFDLGNCAEDKVERGEDANQFAPDLAYILDLGLLDTPPADVPVDAWEVVVEPDYDDEDEPVLAALYNNLTYAIRIPGMPAGGEYEVEVPDDYLGQFPACTPLKVEVGAIGGEDNATFTEEDGFFNTPDCEEDED